ncbi:DUF6019 family protein [Paeniglutamicibacter sp. R2-26]|uniref:DUF6019 family protein n=1 Tax=Paeniglutamicibacter sp. R2-26 TaxID=3144417 RepID=UPI003EE52B82
MTGEMISGMVLSVVVAAIALYALYFVVRAAVRDGIKLAKAAETDSTTTDARSSAQG